MKKTNLLIGIGLILCFLPALLSCPGGGGGGGGGGGSRYSVSGTISAADNSAIDSDVNDTLADYQSNDLPESDVAQELPNPVILGGYVNTPGTGAVTDNGEVGRSHVSGDEHDYYSIKLTENQSITLSIADGAANVDLYLFDLADTDNHVDSSTGTDTTESVTAPYSGDFYIEVRAIDGASNYIMVVGQPITSATVLDPRMEEDFMPGHVIVTYYDQPAAANQGFKQQSRSAFKALTHKSSLLDRIRVYKFSQDTKDEVFQNLNIRPAESNRALYETSDPQEQLKLDTLRVIDALKKDPLVRFAEPDYFRYPLFIPNDPEYTKQWHYPLINLPQAWEITKGDSDVIVAVIDTGILSQHPDIVGQLTNDGYDFISLTSISNDGDGVDDDPEDPGDEKQGGSSFHGTHVSGTVAAASDNNEGVAGVAYQTKIMALRALGVGGGLSSDIMKCVEYAAGLTSAPDPVPDQPADIINMSLGGGGRISGEQLIYDAVRAAGVVIIAAAGNEDTSALSYPASYDGVISVSAVGPDKTLSSYSNYGAEIDVSAPGGDFDASGDCVYSTSGDDTGGSTIQNIYSFSCGTSMASPHMAGVAALMKAVYPASSTQPFDEFLDERLELGLLTEDLADNGETERDNEFGYGLIDAYKAVTEAADPSTIPTFLIVDQNTLDFGNFTEQLIITTSASNMNDPLSIQLPVSTDASWLVVTPKNVDGNNLGEYWVDVDRDLLEDGPYYGTITFDSNQNDVEVSVVMYKNVFPEVGDSGFHYVLLLNENTFATAYQDEVTASNGTYSFSFPSVAAGNYVVFAGTDSDNDLYIGDAGEASGAYISLDQPVYLTVDRNRSGINFNTVFEQTVSADQLATGESPFTGYRRLE